MIKTSPSHKTFLSQRYYQNFVSWIIGHLFKIKGLFFLSYVFLIFSTIVSVFNPLVLQFFFDEAIYRDSNTIVITAVIFLSLYAFSLFSGVIGAWVASKFTENVVRNVQIEFFESIHSKSMSFHDSARTGELLSMATSDSRQLSWMLQAIRMVSYALITTLAIAATMIYLDTRLLIIFLLFIPPIIIAMVWHGRRLGPVSIERQKLFATWQATLQENLAGIRALRTLSNRDREFNKYDRDLRNVREVLIRRGVISAQYYSTLIIYLAVGVLFIVGGWFVYQGEMTPGTLIAFNSLVLLLQGPNDMIRGSVFLGSQGFAGGKRVFNVITEHQQLEDGKITLPERLQGKVDFQNVFFRYNSQGPDVLKEISFTVEPGQTVAIIGHTGCGKTTLGKLIQRLYDVNQGQILIDGVNVQDYPIEELRKQVGVIEQDIFLFSATIRENILYGYGIGNGGSNPELDEKMVQMAKAAQIHDFITTLPKGYDTIIGERGVTLSGGQRQRLAIARAFMVDPPILIMDDSTSAVDAKTEAEIQTAHAALLHKRTTLIVTHRLSTLRKADHVILMSGGRIQDIGSHADLYKRQSEYADIFLAFENLPPIPQEILTSEEVS
ncbi:MAG: ABC transporter ATP-binding protein [Candidatus Hodarchaeales archaeon]|jgi:ATP-binding cassette subfamily B protein